MRLISPHAGYSLQVFEGQEQVIMDARGFGNLVVLQKPVIANFDRGGLLDHEIEVALTYFNFSGLPDGINPISRIGTFDTEAYCQQYPEEASNGKPGRSEMQAQIDTRLRELEKQFPSEFKIIDQPAAAKPWPSYDGQSVEEIIQFQAALGFSPTTIRLYELENQNRSTLVKAMEKIEYEAAGVAYPDEDEVVVSA